YAVRNGRKTGIYHSWDECQAQVTGYHRAVFKSFGTMGEAETFMRGSGGYERRKPANVAKRAPVKAAAAYHVTEVFPGHVIVDPDFFLSDQETGSIQSSLNGSSSILPSLEVYTDGSCRGNGSSRAVAGLGVYYGPSHPHNLSERLPGPVQTNNRAELLAVIRAIETAPRTQHLVVWSDSQYMRQGIETWMEGWKRKGWVTAAGTPVKNKDLWLRLESVRDRFNGRIDFVGLIRKWVRGHNGNAGNEGADALANEGALLPAIP
ncbi:ribonuclease H1-like protein, partial [Phlyctochytrium arcticum]